MAPKAENIYSLALYSKSLPWPKVECFKKRRREKTKTWITQFTNLPRRNLAAVGCEIRF